MNLIFICVFNNPEYLKLLYLLLESIFLYGVLDDNIRILIYTSTDFKRTIENSFLYNEYLIFETNDHYQNVSLACKARLDLFELSTIKTKLFEKVLYLDTDVLVKKPIVPIFQIAVEEVIYAIEEGRIDDQRDFYGASLFQPRELDPYRGGSAFSSGVMLFKVCRTIKRLFSVIKEDIVQRPRDFVCHDQPYIVYHAFRTGRFNKTAMKVVAVNNDLNINSDRTIHHFPGNTGVYYNKYVEMNQFLRAFNDQTVTHILNQTKEYIDRSLLPIIQNCGEKLEGNVLMEHETTNYYPLYENKAKNIISLANTNVKSVLEIGFGSGFSSLLMLIANPYLHITCIDWLEHSYVKPCFDQMKSKFGNRIKLIEGDSLKILPQINKHFDLIHIDGSNRTETVKNDIYHSLRLSERTVIILDDYDFPHIRKLWDIARSEKGFSELNLTLYPTDMQNIQFVNRTANT